jgi:hypothetical protein
VGPYLAYLAFALLPAPPEGTISPPCSPAECLRRITAHVPVTPLAPSRDALAGVWKSGGGLSGFNLYLFQDLHFIHTEWADIQPETIYDKGTWRPADDVIFLSRDADITWLSPTSDSRYLIFRIADDPTTLLLGLDFRLSIFESLVRETPQRARGYLRASSFTRERAWSPGEGEIQKGQVPFRV